MAAASSSSGGGGRAQCPICCEPFTSQVRKPVECPSCLHAACTRCTKSFLLSSLRDPGCMNCGLYFNRAFLDQALTATWRNGALRKHRQAVLVDREKALLPATQPAVERRALWKRCEGERKEAFEAMQESRRQYELAKVRYYEAVRRRNGFWNARQETQERRVFVAACPSERCKGFLSNLYRCGTCLKHFCAHCREEKTAQEAAHVCDPDTVASIRAILSDSKPCPGCGMSINRVSGCDQMYCTLCDVAFSYATGLRVQGVIHNPHYFERLRQLRAQQGEEAEAQQQQPGGAGAFDRDCGVWPPLHFIDRLAQEGFRRLTNSLHRTALNVQHVFLPRLAGLQRRGNENEDLRVAFCLQELTEAAFKQKLEQRERQRELEVDLREVLQVFVLLCMELCYRLWEQRHEEGQRRLLEQHLGSVREMVNEPLRELSLRYNKKPVASVRLPAPEEWPALQGRTDLFDAPRWVREAGRNRVLY
jgi:hypothetical protein